MEGVALVTGYADLHIHLGGAVSPHTLWSIAHQQGFKLPVKSYWEFVKLISASPDKVSSLDDYIKVMHQWTEKIQSSPAAVEQSVYEVIGGQYRNNNVDLIELRFNPAKRNKSSELDLDHIIHAALRGMDRANLEYPEVRTGLIFCLARDFDIKLNTIIVEKAIKYRDRGVIGIDMAGSEKNPIEKNLDSVAAYRVLLNYAASHGLSITIHTGETKETGPEAMVTAIKSFCPQRIGHGIAAAYSKDVMDMLRERDIVLELCPTSNLNTKAVSGIDELKFIVQTLWNNGVKITINTDGPHMLETTIGHEMDLLRSNDILTDGQLAQTTTWARQHSFIKNF
jgi:adenosine deaminase